MAYHVAIVRTQGGQPIAFTEQEIERLVSSRGDLSLVPPSIEGALLDVRLSNGDAEIGSLTLQSGELWVNSPNDQTLRLMIEIAGELGGRVRGDELETYRSLDETYIHPDDKRMAQAQASHSSRRISPWFIRVVGVAVLLAFSYGISRCAQ